MKGIIYLSVLVSCTALISAGILGCSDDDSVSEPEAMYRIRGAVTDEGGAGLRDVTVIVMERTTDARFETVTDASGRYSLEVHEGVYDIYFDADGFVTEYCGPIAADEDVTVAESLDSTVGMDDSRLYGMLIDTEGNPLPEVEVIASSLAFESGETDSATTKTGVNGRFDLAVVGELALDLDFIPRVLEEEFVDIAKLDKPCFVTFVLGTDYPNAHRHNYSEGVTASGVRGPVEDRVFQLVWHDAGETVTYRNGRLRVNGGKLAYTDAGTTCTREVYVRDDGWWPWEYALHVYSDGNHMNSGRWRFYDAMQDYCSINIVTTGWHRVNYTSNTPDIVDVSHSLSGRFD